MTLIDTEAYKSNKETFLGRAVIFFIDHVNFCSDYADGSEKPENRVYEFFRTYWLFPFKQTGCPCCNAVRGLIYGFVLGLIIGGILC